MTKAALRMLPLVDRAVSAWHIPVIGMGMEVSDLRG